MKIVRWWAIVVVVMLMQACSSGKAVLSHDADIQKYSYVVLGEEESGGGTLDDIGMAVQNAIAETRLEVIPLEDVIDKIFLGEHVLAAEIYISSEKWEGGRTYITLIFYDYDTKQRVAILKSNGMGLSNSQDRNLALRAIRKKLKKVFGEE